MTDYKTDGIASAREIEKMADEKPSKNSDLENKLQTMEKSLPLPWDSPNAKPVEDFKRAVEAMQAQAKQTSFSIDAMTQGYINGTGWTYPMPRMAGKTNLTAGKEPEDDGDDEVSDEEILRSIETLENDLITLGNEVETLDTQLQQLEINHKMTAKAAMGSIMLSLGAKPKHLNEIMPLLVTKLSGMDIDETHLQDFVLACQEVVDSYYQQRQSS